jgi:hypothetical protein
MARKLEPEHPPEPSVAAFDEALRPFRDFLESLASAIDVHAAADSSEAVLGEDRTGLRSERFYVDRIRVDLPFELEVLTPEIGMQLGAGPPTQYTETTIMPVFHRLSMTIESNEK